MACSRAALERDVRAGKRWIYFHGPFTATRVQPLRRACPESTSPEISSASIPPALWRVPSSVASRRTAQPGAAGLELSLDSILTGEPGEAVLLKDRAGRRYDSPSRLVREPVPGNDVVLTLDAELQEIAERGLDDALAEMKAEGGDVVFLDPTTGELLALASRQTRGSGFGIAPCLHLYRSLRARVHRQALYGCGAASSMER